MEKLRVEISGDASELQEATKKAVKDLQNFEKVADKSISSIEKPSARSAKGITSLGKASANATPTLQEFSRVIQDAPFGIQGVGNNITQLVSNFGNLSRSAGGSRAAIKLLLSSFIGPAGILFAISTVVSLLTVFGDRLFSSKTEAEKLTKATEEAAKKLDDYVKSLKDANRAQLEGQQSAQKQIITLGQLRSVAEDASKSTEDRARAIKELRRLFPNYFKDLSDEKILTGGLSGVYDQLTNSILNRAKATAATNILVANAEKEIAILAKQGELQERLNTAIKTQNFLQSSNQGNRSGGVSFGLVKAENEVSSLNKELAELDSQLKQLESSNIDLESIVSKNGGIDLSGVTLKGGSPKVEIDPQIVLNPNARATLESSVDKANKTLQEIVTKRSEAFNLDFGEDQLKKGLKRLSNIRIGEKTNLELSLEALSNRINDTISGSLSNSLANIGQSLGEAIAQGGNVIQSAGNALVSGFGNFLSRMGQLLIEYGTLAVLKGKLDIAIATGGPVSIGAGLAAVAVGIALSAAGAALGSAAGGGFSGSGVSGGGSNRTTSFSGSSGGGFNGGRVVFEIEGTKLVGVLNRTANRNLAIGGN